MVGVGVEPPAPPADAAAGMAARLAARGVRPRRVSAKRSWPPSCGRFPAPPPAADGRAHEAAAPAAVLPAVQNGAPPQHVQDNVDAAVAPTAISSAAWNGALPQQGQNNAEETVAPASASPTGRDSIVPHGMPQPGPEKVMEEGDRGENGEAGSMINGTGAALLDGQEGNSAMEVAASAVAVLESCGSVGAASSAQNSVEGAGLLVVEEGGGGSVGQLADDGDFREMENRLGGVESEKKVDGAEGIGKKRWLMSAVNPPPKRRAVSAVRRFPPGCGWAAVTTEGTEVSEVSPMRTIPPGSEGAAVTPDGGGVLEVSPIRTFPPGCGRPAVTTKGSGNEKGLPLEATRVPNGDASAMEALAAIPVSGGDAAPALSIQASREKAEGKRVVDKGSSKAHNKVQESQIASGSLVDFVGAKEASDQPQKFVTKASPKHGFAEKMKGKISPREGKQVAQVVGGDKVKSKLDGSSREDIFKTPTSRAVDNSKGKRSDGNKMNAALLDNAEASREGNMRRKALSTKKEVASSNANTKEDRFACKPKSDGKGKNTLQRPTESKYAKHVTTNQVEESDDMDLVRDQIIVQGLMAPDKCPWTQGRKSIVSASKSLAPRKKLKGKDAAPIKQLPWKVASCELINDETIDDNEDSYPEDDGKSRALVMYDEKREKREVTANLLPSVPSRSHDSQSRDNDVDARRKIRKLLQKFQLACRKFMQLEEKGSCNVGRIDYAAVDVLKQDPTYTKLDPIVGNVPGVEVGDEFHFRVELSIAGLHRPYQAGIDTYKVNGVLIAISIVASGGYPDELSSSDELIYTGSGGKASGKKEAEDQKLKCGNLALKNCINTKTPVRVIHGFKGQSRGEVAHSKGKQVSTFTYDGLYNVVECWQEALKGSMVFKYRLQRIPGQPQLALHVVKVTKKSKIREGLLLPDISQGSERIPICVINTIDDLRPAPFKYVTRIIYPPWYQKEPPTGCDCTNGCSDSVKCACAVKNGGEIPYNFNGAIVEAKPLIYECGPSCRCPPTCHNRVSQHGIKIPLEIFKTGKTGWGVRSLSSIPSGSFICEYAGELLQDKEAEKRENDEYLFDIGHNYHDEELWEGLKSIPGLESSASSSKTIEGFTIDAAECGNVGRFINHCCSPNLYAQNVLWDHDDVEMPHVMLFAIENIPPLQELTYHYNYTIGQVHDKNGEEKVKDCYCGSAECEGRLY